MRVVGIGNESLEFCGGTHVRRAGDIGMFKILSEAGVAQGVRRIEAVTGAGALDYLRKLEDELAHTAHELASRRSRSGRGARREAARGEASSPIARSTSSSSGSRRAVARAI